MFERILVPLDGSELAEAILPQLRGALFRPGVDLILVRAVPRPYGMDTEAGRAMAALEDCAADYLRMMERWLTGQGARVRTVIRRGPAAETILAVGGEEGASLIALSTHGRTGIGRWVLGSVAEKVLRASPMPVLAMRAAAGPREQAFRTLVVAIDSSDLSLEAVAPAIELARAFGSRVRPVHVCEGPECAVPVPQMTEAYERFREAGIPVEPVMAQGDPATGLLDACRECSADVIAIATHGRSGISRWALGSVAEKVLRASTIPLLVVRAGRPAAASAELAASGEAKG